MLNTSTPTDDWVPTVCRMCFNGCGILVHRADGVIAGVQGNPSNPINYGRICIKGLASPMLIYDPNRVKKPLKRTNSEKGIGVDPKWKEISWDEALDTIAEHLRRIRKENPNKLAFLSIDHQTAHIMAVYAAAYGTKNLWFGGGAVQCGAGHHQVSHLLHASFLTIPDLNYCNYLIMAGSQFGFGSYCIPPYYGEKMAAARRRGMKLVVVDPFLSASAAKADEWLPIRPGTDAALALGWINTLVNDLKIYDKEYLRCYTNGPYLVKPDGYYFRLNGKPAVWDTSTDEPRPYDDVDHTKIALEGNFKVDEVNCSTAFECLREHVKKYTPKYVEQITTIPAPTIRRIAEEFGRAAMVGSTIVIDGKTLPYRPACLFYFKGAQGHKHSMLTSIALELVNAIVGAMDVPGGALGCNAYGPFWRPKEGPDGMLIPGIRMVPFPFPPRPARTPDSYTLFELFPIACDSSQMFVLGMLESERFRLPYKIEAMLHYFGNAMINTGNPKQVEAALKKIPFITSISLFIDETTEFADIVLPDTTFFERLDPFPNLPFDGFIPALLDQWVWQMRLPVVEPMYDTKPCMEILLELADRAGYLKDLLTVWNAVFLKEPYKVDPSKKYTWEELVDRWAKSRFGADKGLDWFKERQFIAWSKKVEEVYWRPFTKGRSHIYFEFFKKTGEDVKKVIEELCLEWDTSDYQPLPDWKPCLSHQVDNSVYDLYAINYKVVEHSTAGTLENPLLTEISQHSDRSLLIVLHPSAAKKRRIRDGDIIWVESVDGNKVRGKAKLSEGVHPEVVAIAGSHGKWAQGEPVAKGKGVQFNTLVPITLQYTDLVSCNEDLCIKVRVYR